MSDLHGFREVRALTKDTPPVAATLFAKMSALFRSCKFTR
jgi:hypothetical protein